MVLLLRRSAFARKLRRAENTIISMRAQRNSDAPIALWIAAALMVNAAAAAILFSGAVRQVSAPREKDTTTRLLKMILSFCCCFMLIWYCNILQRLLMERRDGFDLAMPEAKGPHRVSLLRPTSDSHPDFSRIEQAIEEVEAKTSGSWVAATAAPHHATGNRDLLSGFVIEHDNQFVHAVDGVPRKVVARGAVITDTVILPDVWFVPGLTENLVSVSQLAELDHSIGFGRGECCITSSPDKVVGKGRLQRGGHYVLDFLKVPLAI